MLTYVRGIMLGLVLCLAATGAPAQAMAPDAAPQAEQRAGRDWQTHEDVEERSGARVPHGVGR